MTLGKGVEQLQIFGTFWALATIATIVYLFANGFVKTQLARVIADLIFSLFAAPGFLIANVHFNNGEFRLFVFFAVALGAITSYICFRSTLDKLSAKLYNLFTTKKVDNNGKTIL